MGFGLETICVIVLAVFAWKSFVEYAEDYEAEDEEE